MFVPSVLPAFPDKASAKESREDLSTIGEAVAVKGASPKPIASVPIKFRTEFRDMPLPPSRRRYSL